MRWDRVRWGGSRARVGWERGTGGVGAGHGWGGSGARVGWELGTVGVGAGHEMLWRR